MIVGYLQMLIWTMLFVVIVEMIFPQSDMKKYLKLILGFVVVYSILSPIVEGLLYLGKEDPFATHLRYYQMELGQVPTFDAGQEQRIKQEENLIALYEKQLEKQLKTVLQKQLDIEVLEVKLEVEYVAQKPELKAVWVSVSRKEEQGEIYVPRIKIGDKSEDVSINDEALKEGVKKSINDFYNWDNVNIHITVVN